MKRFLFVLVVLALVLTAFPAVQPVGAQQKPMRQIPQDAEYMPGEVIVEFRSGKTLMEYQGDTLALASELSAAIVEQSESRALLRFDASADVLALVETLSARPDVLYAEPNYIVTLNDPAPERIPASGSKYVIRKVEPSAETDGKSLMAVPVENMRAMRTKSGFRGKATYPSDPYLWWNPGWDVVGASIVWPNTTASTGVCVIDTGVDYNHKDLTTSYVVKGPDLVNGDTDPMDDNGHGTHVAGIIAARGNNLIGIAGASNGKVVAVKVLDAQGVGTIYDVSAGIRACADRTDAKVMNLSLGMYSPSLTLYNAVYYAVSVKGKLLVAAAGNDGATSPIYPAGFADWAVYPEFTDTVIAVGASGEWYQPDPVNDPDWWEVDYWTRANYSNFGDWVTLYAPGTSIFSTTPWDRPFYLNNYQGVDGRYYWMDGTSMAAPFVAAAAARRWGYITTLSNNQVGWGLYNYAPDTIWEWGYSEYKPLVNVAAQLNRGGMSGSVYDAWTGLPLNGAQLLAYQNGTQVGSGTLAPSTWKADPYEPDPTRIYMNFNAYAEILNLPAGPGYTFKANMANYTASAQPVFQQNPWANYIGAGYISGVSRTAIPPKSVNFDATLGWWWYFWDITEGVVNNPDMVDLDLNVWLPSAPNPLDVAQPGNYIVGPEGSAFGYLDGSPLGTMTLFPFARFKREGGWEDYLKFESTTIASRKAHGSLATNAALPYYPGNYTIAVTDWGQTIDQDGDGCGDNYGYGFDNAYDPAADPDCPPTNSVGTYGIPLLGVFGNPYVYVWKDGLVKAFVIQSLSTPGGACNTEWWNAISITSGTSGTPTYIINDTCGDETILPYLAP